MALVNSRREAISVSNRTTAIAATVTHEGEITASAKNGMNAIEPRADCGRTKLSMSAATANTVSTRTPVQAAAGIAGARSASNAAITTATAATELTYARVRA